MAGFKKAAKSNKKCKIAIQGASGSGKTFSALSIATNLCADGKRIAFVDTENSAQLYAPPFDFDVDDFFGDAGKLNYSPDKLIEKLEAARICGEYDVVVVDSLTHFWKEPGGFLSQIDAICAAQRAKGQKGDSFAAWKSVDPAYRKLMNYIRHYPLHVILCVRAKQTYERTEGAKGVRKIGLEAEFRSDYEYDLDAQFTLDENHVMVPLKHRLRSYLDGKVFPQPGKDVAELILSWINEGAPGQDEVVAPVAAAAALPARTPGAEPTPVPPMVDVEESGPLTSPMGDDVVPGILAKIAAANSIDELKVVAEGIKVAYKDKLFDVEAYNKVMSPAYSVRLKALKAQVAA